MSTSTHQLADFILQHQPLTVITGAGCSASSGIPTYRDASGTWLRSDPIQHNEFVNMEAKRQRYWARSYTGWPAVSKAEPNRSHQALVDLEQQGLIRLLVTQNVDRLHQKAGHKNVVDLHGRLDLVHCLDCFQEYPRDEIQESLRSLNPHLDDQQGRLAPDGDADVPDDKVEKVKIPHCPACGGTLKPEVVFYGGGVNKNIVNGVYNTIEESNGVLIVGSSLMVFSSYRFCRRAFEKDIPIAILNAGDTRADEIAALKISEACEPILAGASNLIRERANV